MAATRSLLLKYQVITDLGSVALLTTAAGVVGPILLFWATRQTKLSLLFRRPSWARLASRPAQWHSDGHVTFQQPEAGDHLYLVDGSGYIFRAYHALPPLTRKSDGLPVGAVQGFCNMLWKLLKETRANEKPTHLAVIFDQSSKTFRNKIYPGIQGPSARAAC